MVEKLVLNVGIRIWIFLDFLKGFDPNNIIIINITYLYFNSLKVTDIFALWDDYSPCLMLFKETEIMTLKIKVILH